MDVLRAYIEERYGDVVNFDQGLIDQVLARYTERLHDLSATMEAHETGFFTYSLKGDAIIVWDIYTAKAHRQTKACWGLFARIIDLADKAGKRVIIGFSEKIGQNRESGLKAMEAAAFKEAYSTPEMSVFLRGVY